MRASRIFALARTMRWASGGRSGEEGAGDLLGGEAADLAQRQRHLGVRRQGRMAAGEDQPQPVVLDALVLPRRGIAGVCASSRSASSASEASKRARRRMRVDRLEAAGRDQPRARDWRARRPAATAPAPPRRRRAAPPRRGRSRRAGGSAWRGRGAIRSGRPRPPSRATVRPCFRSSCLPLRISPANILALGQGPPRRSFFQGESTTRVRRSCASPPPARPPGHPRLGLWTCDSPSAGQQEVLGGLVPQPFMQ